MEEKGRELSADTISIRICGRQGRYSQERPASTSILGRGSMDSSPISWFLCQSPVVDIRPLKSRVKGLTFLRDDATELSQFPTGSVNSISSLHTAEHFGLGRYSDPIDPAACFKFMAALKRVLAPGGRLYFSVPIGRERVEFNAHRVFAPQTILESFPGLQLLSFSFVGDDGDLYEDVDPLTVPKSELACGLFEFTKADR